MRELTTTTRYDPAPITLDPDGRRPIVPPRPRVSNAAWDAMRMLRAAAGGTYPSAEGYGQAAEPAYWRQRVAWEAEDAHHEEIPT